MDSFLIRRHPNGDGSLALCAVGPIHATADSLG